MDADSRIGADAATVTPLDQVFWSVLSAETELAPFTRAWLALLCRMLAGAERAVLVLRQNGTLAPLARWPDGDPGSAGLNRVAELALTEDRGVVSRPRTRPGESLASHLAFPLAWDGEVQGVLAVECTGISEAALREVMRQLQWGAAWIELRERRVRAADDASRLRQGYAALEIAATTLSAETFDAAARATATDIAVRLGVGRVGIGWLKRHSIDVKGLSHTVGSGQRAEATVNLAAAMEEAVDQGASLLYPLPGVETLPSLAAHARLVAQGGGPHVLTVPLTAHGRIEGAVTIESETPIDQATIDVVEAIAGLIGPILHLQRRQERWLSTIAFDIVNRTLHRLVGPEHYVLKLSTVALVAVVAFFATFHIDYRVSGTAVVEGEVRRSIAAGLDGYIGSELARAGQVVHEGDLLATLDSTEVNLQRLRWIATRQQHQLELDKALGGGNRAEVNIASSQIAEANAEIALLDAQLARTKIVAPFGGLITNGDLSQAVGMPVQRAQVLFEIAPLDSYRVIIRIPDTEIGRIKPDATGRLVLSALPDRTFGLHLERITPIAEQAEGANAFRVEARLDEIIPQLRPNMEGVAKLDAGRHLLIWAWTHRLIDTIRLWLWSWWP